MLSIVASRDGGSAFRALALLNHELATFEGASPALANAETLASDLGALGALEGVLQSLPPRPVAPRRQEALLCLDGHCA